MVTEMLAYGVTIEYRESRGKVELLVLRVVWRMRCVSVDIKEWMFEFDRGGRQWIREVESVGRDVSRKLITKLSGSCKWSDVV